MKIISLVVFLCLGVSTLFAQASKIDVFGTTNKLVKGTIYKDGKIAAKAGYEMKLSEDKKAVIVSMLTSGGPITSGQYYCECLYLDRGACFPQLSGGKFECASSNEDPCFNACEVFTKNTETTPGKPVLDKSWKKLVLTKSTSD
jgi:hypothetical protein